MQTDLKFIVRDLSQSMACNCDLDNWEPEPSTGHSWACRIHKAALAREAASRGDNRGIVANPPFVRSQRAGAGREGEES